MKVTNMSMQFSLDHRVRLSMLRAEALSFSARGVEFEAQEKGFGAHAMIFRPKDRALKGAGVMHVFQNGTVCVRGVKSSHACKAIARAFAKALSSVNRTRVLVRDDGAVQNISTTSRASRRPLDMDATFVKIRDSPHHFASLMYDPARMACIRFFALDHAAGGHCSIFVFPNGTLMGSTKDADTCRAIFRDVYQLLVV